MKKKKKKHKSKINHERYRNIHVEYCKDNCPKTGKSLKIVLFQQEEKLRDHAIRHFINDEKAIRIWGKAFPYINIEEVNECRRALKEFGCPGTPCLKENRIGGIATKEQCNLYNECKDIVDKLVDDYVKMTYEILKESSKIPRYACCVENRGESLWIMPNSKLLAIAYFHPDKGFYNIATCYPVTTGKSWQEARDYIRRRIFRKSLNKPRFCTESMWGSGASLKEVFQKAFVKRNKKEP